MSILQDVEADIEIRNQARVHLWYQEKFGLPYPPLNSAVDGLSKFLANACMVALRYAANGELELYAPKGLEDTVAMIIRPNITPNFDMTHFQAKADRWKQSWPELQILSADVSNSS